MQAHYNSVFIIVFALLIAPFYWFFNAPHRERESVGMDSLGSFQSQLGRCL